MKQQKCKTEGCYSMKQTGDPHFCNDCRKEWRDHCTLHGLGNGANADLIRTISEETKEDMLKTFYQRLKAKVQKRNQ